MKPSQALLAVFLSAMPFHALAEDTVGSGSFSGLSGHETTGQVQIVRADDGSYRAVLAENFTFDGAPDPKLGFGKAGTYDKATTFSPLARNSGAQAYEIPSDIDPSAYDEFYVWCEKFSVPLGVARLE